MRRTLGTMLIVALAVPALAYVGRITHKAKVAATVPAPMPTVAQSSAAVIVHKPIYMTLTFAWTAESDPSVTGYNLYFGLRSQNYTNMANGGNAASVTVSNFQVGVTYYFALTAYDAVGLESPFSAELVYTIPKPVAKPVTNVVTVVGTNISSGDRKSVV